MFVSIFVVFTFSVINHTIYDIGRTDLIDRHNKLIVDKLKN